MSAPDERFGRWKIEGKWRVWVPDLLAIAKKDRSAALTKMPDARGVLWIELGFDECGDVPPSGND